MGVFCLFIRHKTDIGKIGPKSIEAHYFFIVKTNGINNVIIQIYFNDISMPAANLAFGHVLEEVEHATCRFERSVGMKVNTGDCSFSHTGIICSHVSFLSQITRLTRFLCDSMRLSNDEKSLNSDF